VLFLARGLIRMGREDWRMGGFAALKNGREI